MTPTIAAQDPATAPPKTVHRRDLATLQVVAYLLIAVTAGWFLLNQLASVLRPLMVAVFLAYVLMPYHSRLRKFVPAPVSIVLLAGATAGVLVALAMTVYVSVLGLNEELPRLQHRAVELYHWCEDYVHKQAPWLNEESTDTRRPEQRLAELGGRIAGPILNAAADALLEACLVGLYLLFLLLEASRLPDRVRKAYTPERAEEILDVAGKVNAAIISYLKAKVKSSLLLAIPAGLGLWAFGVKFALLWAVLTFLCNFIPYIGSVISVTLAVGFAFLQLEMGWQPFAVAGWLLACQVVSASVIEPTVLGKAVGLSPLVILGSLAFWGLIWGIPGMFLAVPLTVVGVIVMSQFPFTRPITGLLSGGEK